MKAKLKKIIPSFAIETYRNMRKNKILSKLYSYEKNRALESINYFGITNNENNLRSIITYNYHSIEKGLSHQSIRFNFGKNAFTQLFKAMDRFIELNFNPEDERFNQAIQVIENYVIFHEDNNKDVDKTIILKLNNYKNYVKNSNSVVTAGALEFDRSSIGNYSTKNFTELLNSRYSVRDFGEDNINIDDVIDSIQLATKSPNTCNTQSWKVHAMFNQNLIEQVLALQGGYRGFGENIRGLLLITCNKEYIVSLKDINQTYIDGGLYTMSLIYLLTERNIASCPLHANFYVEKEKEIRNLLNLDNSEDLICFLAIGSFPETIKVAASPREISNNIIEIYN